MIRKILAGAVAVGSITTVFGTATPAAAAPVKAPIVSDGGGGLLGDVTRQVSKVQAAAREAISQAPGGGGDVYVPSVGGLGPIGPIGPGPAGDILRRLPSAEPSVPGDGAGSKVVAVYRAVERALPGGDVYVPSVGGLGPIGPIGPGPVGDILEEVLGG